ncbi:MAG: 1-acyl-sn-glycerol-3-phosphate acyltransferase, partial [Actinobacteria bacterium]|nr:1-acyl-sn-glycerol-3-phosphate acyltransferase [Actinomycetota bacterium]
MLYWFLKTIGLGPWLKAIWRPYVEGAENIPATGGAILASNHL